MSWDEQSVAGPAGLFESIVVHANDVVMVTEAEPVDEVDGGPRVMYVNPAFTRMTGYAASEIVGLTPRVLQSAQTDRTQLDRLRAALSRWEPVEVELLNVRKDGTEFWVQLNVFPVADSAGWYTHWVAFQRDITARRRREIAAAAMLDNVSGLTLLLDHDGAVTAASQSLCRVLCRSAEELVGLRFLHLIHADDQSVAATLMVADPVVRLGRRTSEEIRVAAHDGSWRWLTISVADVDIAGRGAVLFTCNDVTAQRAAQADLDILNRRFRGAFDDAPIGMALTTPQGHFIQVNTALAALLGRARDALTALTIHDVTHPDDRAAAAQHRMALLRGTATRSRNVTRFRHTDGTMIDVLHSSSIVLRAPGEVDHVIDHFEDVTERAQLRHRVLHDNLTGLPNRTLLEDRLERALQRRPEGTTVLYIDVDRFKAVNDTHGHHAGDAVLVELARRLRAAVTDDDTVARISGDEFVVLCGGATVGRALATADRLTAALTRPFLLAGEQRTVTASIGVAVSHPDRSYTAPELLRDGDVAMYSAKNSGGAKVVVFNRALGQQVRDRIRLETELRHAIGNDELVLHYQPQVRLADRSLIGLEALVRWQHPRRGLLAPHNFLLIAEEAGLLGDLGQWVLTQAVDAAARRWQAGTRTPVWVNVTAPELEDHSYAGHLRQLLIERGLPGQAIGVEITENVLIHDVGRARTTLENLRDAGVHLAVDDFGTGYSSLSYLARFPVDVVKIDHTFIDGLDDETRRRESSAIIGAVIGLAHALELEVIAEGIETTAQAQAMQRLGCAGGQGFLFGRPQPLTQSPG